MASLDLTPRNQQASLKFKPITNQAPLKRFEKKTTFHQASTKAANWSALGEVENAFQGSFKE